MDNYTRHLKTMDAYKKACDLYQEFCDTFHDQILAMDNALKCEQLYNSLHERMEKDQIEVLDTMEIWAAAAYAKFERWDEIKKGLWTK